AEDGIRDFHVTGVQTCALPIWRFLQWALQKAGPDLGERLLAALECEQASAERARPPDEPFVRDLETYGVLPARRCAALRRAALRSEERRVGKEGRCTWVLAHGQ